MKKTLGIALGAGGARGIAHIGFLKALDEEGIRPDFLSGSSMGSIIGACYAKGMTPDAMRDICRGLKAGDIVNVGLMPISKLGLMKWTKTRRLMTSFLEDCEFSDLAIPFSCVAVDLKTGKLQVFREGNVLDAIFASSSMPTVFRPVEKDGMIFVDGGVLCRVPVRQVKDMGADVVVAVDVLGKCSEVEKVPKMFSLLPRVYDLIDTEKTQSQRRAARRYTDFWIEPAMGNVSQYKLKYSEEVYEAGYHSGKEYAPKIRKALEEQ